MPSLLPQSRSRRARFHRAFTLLELIISIAIVLLLMLAVTKIFSITSATVGASQGLAASTRDARAAQAVISRDVGAMAADAPFIVIGSHVIPAFRNPLDAKGDKDYDPSLPGVNRANALRSIDLRDDGVESTYGPFAPAAQNVRNFRSDVFTFFARDRFPRKTNDNRPVAAGNIYQGALVSPASYSEAWVWYGHLSLANNQSGFPRAGGPDYTALTDAGAGDAQSNPNNFYANQFTLGRVVTLLQSNLTNEPGKTQPPFHFVSDTIPVGGPAAGFSPFDATVNPTNPKVAETVADDATTNVPRQLVTARYDLANINIADATRLVNAQPSNVDWWRLLPGMINPAAGSRMPFRANLFVNKPISIESVAEQTPIFVTGCSSFVVEFAGDFVTQREDAQGNPIDENGNPNLAAPGPDGRIDYIIDPVTHSRKTLWYGFPRDSNGDGVIRAADGDVVPVADWAGQRLPFERWLPYETNPGSTTSFPPRNGTGRYDNGAGLGVTISPDPRLVNYQVAWGPDSIRNPANPRPTMYRLVLTIDRPEMEGRTATGQSFEYVINAP